MFNPKTSRRKLLISQDGPHERDISKKACSQEASWKESDSLSSHSPPSELHDLHGGGERGRDRESIRHVRAVHAKGIHLHLPSRPSFYGADDVWCHREVRAERTSSNREVIWCPTAQKSTGATFPVHSTSGKLLGRTEEDLQAVYFSIAARLHQTWWRTSPKIFSGFASV